MNRMYTGAWLLLGVLLGMHTYAVIDQAAMTQYARQLRKIEKQEELYNQASQFVEKNYKYLQKFPKSQRQVLKKFYNNMKRIADAETAEQYRDVIRDALDKNRPIPEYAEVKPEEEEKEKPKRTAKVSVKDLIEVLQESAELSDINSVQENFPQLYNATKEFIDKNDLNYDFLDGLPKELEKQKIAKAAKVDSDIKWAIVTAQKDGTPEESDAFLVNYYSRVVDALEDDSFENVYYHTALINNAMQQPEKYIDQLVAKAKEKIGEEADSIQYYVETIAPKLPEDYDDFVEKYQQQILPGFFVNQLENATDDETNAFQAMQQAVEEARNANIKDDDITQFIQGDAIANELQEKEIYTDSVQNVVANVQNYLKQDDTSLDTLGNIAYKDLKEPPKEEEKELTQEQQAFLDAKEELDSQLSNAQTEIENNRPDNAIGHIQVALESLANMYQQIKKGEVDKDAELKGASASQHIAKSYGNILQKVREVLGVKAQKTGIEKAEKTIQEDVLDKTIGYQLPANGWWNTFFGTRPRVLQLIPQEFQPDPYNQLTYDQIYSAHKAYGMLQAFKASIEKDVAPTQLDTRDNRELLDTGVLQVYGDLKKQAQVPQFVEQAAKQMDEALNDYLQRQLTENNPKIREAAEELGSAISIMQAWHNPLQQRKNLASDAFARQQISIAYYFRNAQMMLNGNGKQLADALLQNIQNNLEIAKNTAQGVTGVLMGGMQKVNMNVPSVEKLDSLSDWVKNIINDFVQQYNNKLQQVDPANISQEQRKLIEKINKSLSVFAIDYGTDEPARVPEAQQKPDEKPKDAETIAQNIDSIKEMKPESVDKILDAVTEDNVTKVIEDAKESQVKEMADFIAKNDNYIQNKKDAVVFLDGVLNNISLTQDQKDKITETKKQIEMFDVD